MEEGASQGEDGGEPEGEEEDVAPTKEKEVPLSPPPSPQSPAEEAPDPPQQEEEEEEEPDGEERTPVAELPEEEKQDGDEEEEEEPEREDERAPSQEKEEPLPPEEQPVSPKQDRPLRRGREDTDSGNFVPRLSTGMPCLCRPVNTKTTLRQHFPVLCLCRGCKIWGCDSEIKRDRQNYHPKDK